MQRTEEEFKSPTHFLVEKILKEIGGGLNRIYFRMIRTKWASLSSKMNLTLNKLMRYLPEYLLHYVIFHEIIYLQEKKQMINSGRELRKLENYQDLEKDLCAYWFQIAKRFW